MMEKCIPGHRGAGVYLCLPRINTVLITILPLCLLFSQAAIAATGTVNYNTTYQQIEGFGAAAVYDCPSLTSHSQRETLYDLMFRDMGLDVLRIRNSVGYDDSGVTATKTIVAAARQSGRNPNLKLELVPWSPAASVKTNGSVNGGTLAKDTNDPNYPPYYYVYDRYAKWWADSLDTWSSNPNGLVPDYISMQNEPDWEPSYDGCKFLATESSSYAGYDLAFQAVYNAIYARRGSNTPKVIAPETMGFGNSKAYIDALNSRGQMNRIYGFSHHLYSDGDYTNPDGMITGMENYAASYGDYYNKPLFMTEYVLNGSTPDFSAALYMAWHIHNTLVHEGVTSFYWWTLFRTSTASTGGMININNSAGTYEIRDLYYFFKHYSYFTDPNWYVVDATTNPSDNLRMTAFKNPDANQLTVVILNKSTNSDSVTLTLNNFAAGSSQVYRSSASEHWMSLGEFSNPFSLPAQSITTISFTAPVGKADDYNAPTPNPMTWSSAPTATGAGTITMTASTAGDTESPPVQYYFECTNHGEANSTWQSSPTYTASGLTPLTQYSFRVKARDSAPARNETGWSGTLSATTLALPTDVNIIGSWLTGTTHARENGNNRALIFIAHGELTSDMNLGSVTYGGQAMTKVIDRNYTGASSRAYAAAFILNEAGIAAASGSTFVPTWSGTSPTAYGYSSAFFSNVDQTNPVGAKDSNGTTAATVVMPSLSTNNKDMVILAATCGNSGSYTLNNGFIEGTDQTMSSTATGVTGRKPATGAAETPSATYSGSVNRQMIIGFVLKVAGPTCATILASDLNGDCYVDYKDLKIMADYWLNTDCTEPTNCGGADFEPTDGTVDFLDFSDFAVQWMQCNNPPDANCS